MCCVCVCVCLTGGRYKLMGVFICLKTCVFTELCRHADVQVQEQTDGSYEHVKIRERRRTEDVNKTFLRWRPRGGGCRESVVSWWFETKRRKMTVGSRVGPKIVTTTSQQAREGEENTVKKELYRRRSKKGPPPM